MPRKVHHVQVWSALDQFRFSLQGRVCPRDVMWRGEAKLAIDTVLSLLLAVPLRHNHLVQEVGRLDHPKGNPRQAVERLISSKGGVVWHDLLPSRMVRDVTWHSRYKRGARRLSGTGGEQRPVTSPGAARGQHEDGRSAARGDVDDTRSGQVATHPAMLAMFSRVEDRLFWR